MILLEKEIKELINDAILSKAAEFFAVPVQDLTYIGGFQNFIYEYEKNQKTYILRLTHSSHRNISGVKGELDWVQYLYGGGVSVSQPILSRHDNLVETIGVDDSYFIVTSFEKAKGEKIFYPECMENDALARQCGEITGQIHHLTRNYMPRGTETKRHDWTENYYLKNMKKFVPSDQRMIYDEYEKLKTQISKLEKGDRYGLIHGDINVGNFVLDDGKLTLFDFDECQYSWFVEDIAIQVFYMVYVILDDSINERNAQARRFLEFFLKGYEQHTHIDQEALTHLDLFLRLRELIVYIGMYRSLDFTKMNDWTRSYIEESRRRLEQGICIVELR